jgi:hypothetical protein
MQDKPCRKGCGVCSGDKQRPKGQIITWTDRGKRETTAGNEAAGAKCIGVSPGGNSGLGRTAPSPRAGAGPLRD